MNNNMGLICAVAVRFGGYVVTTTSAGPLYFHANNTPANANWNYGAEILPYASHPEQDSDNINKKIGRILFHGYTSN